MKKFRTVIGGSCIAMFILFMFRDIPNEAYRDNLTSGVVENVKAGDILSKEDLKLDEMMHL